MFVSSLRTLGSVIRQRCLTQTTMECKINTTSGHCKLVQYRPLCRPMLTTPSRSLSTSAALQADVPREALPISLFPMPAVEDLPQDIKETLQQVEEKAGFIPNVYRALSHRPAEFRAFFAYYAALMEKDSGSLTKAEKEMIVVATSANNNCLYCVIAHGALHRIYSKKPYVADQLAINWEMADLSEREQAIVVFALDLCDCETVREEQIEELSQHGLSREDVWDIGAIVALFALSNRMAHLTGMRPNEEFYLMGRMKRDK